MIFMKSESESFSLKNFKQEMNRFLWVFMLFFTVIPFSFILYLNLFYSPEIIVGIPIILFYLLFVLLAGFYVNKFYNTKKFLGHHFDFVSPSYCLVFLFVFLVLYYNLPKSVPHLYLLAIFSLIVAFPVFVGIFIMFRWVMSLKKKEHGLQIVWIHHQIKRYPIVHLVLAVIAFLSIPLSEYYAPGIQGIFVAASLYFGALFSVTTFPLVNGEDMRWFCETGLTSINNELKKKSVKKSTIDNYLLPFPTIVEVFNDFLENSKYPGSPYISRKSCYNRYKALLMSFAEEKGDLRDSSLKGVQLMVSAVKRPTGLEFFYKFIEGLNCIYPDKTCTETFETPFGFTVWLERHHTSVGIVVLILSAMPSLLILFSGA